MGKEPSNEIDQYIGSRIRLRREALGISQTEFGKMLNVSFQQVQKYEAGKNHLSCARLHAAAKNLKTAYEWFLPPIEDETLTPENFPITPAERRHIQMLREVGHLQRKALSNAVEQVHAAIFPHQEPPPEKAQAAPRSTRESGPFLIDLKDSEDGIVLTSITFKTENLDGMPDSKRTSYIILHPDMPEGAALRKFVNRGAL
jgi:transcriptional regulator with XRE-family HTH domain